MKKSNRSYLLLPLLSIIVVTAIVALTIMPKIEEIQTISTSIDNEKAVGLKLDTKLTELQKLNESAESLRANYNLAASTLPDQKSIANLIVTFEQIAQRSEIGITSMQIAPGELILTKPSISQNAEQIEVSMTTQGDINAIKLFLKNIYTGSRLLNTRSVNITTNADGNNNIQLTLYSFFKPRPELPKNPEEQIPQLSAEDNETLALLETLSSFSPDAIIN